MASRLRERSIATLHIPTGYAFRINGKIAEPNLMQRLAVVQVRDKKQVGNWSGTGAGKTLSAVLASRVINAQVTVICCPNSVVEGWEKAILDIFPDSVVAKKTFTPDWTKANRLDPPQPPLKRGEQEEDTLLTSRWEEEESTPLTSWAQPDVANSSLFSKNWGDSQPENNGTQKAPLLNRSFSEEGWGDLNCGNQPDNPDYPIGASSIHIAVNDKVIACDMAHVPLEDEALDVAIFSLSLMGSNFTNYLREAYRTLKLDGQLHIIEATSRFSNLSQFRTELEVLGFDVVSVQDMWKFTHIRALKTERRPQDGVELRF